MARVRRAKWTTGSWRWALVLAWPFACLNPMPDDFPNHHDDDRAVTPAANTPEINGPSVDEAPAPQAPEAEEPAGGFGDDGVDEPDAGAPRADAGTEEDDVSP